MKTGVECEFFLIRPTARRISDSADTQAKPCYDQQALMRRYDVIAEICDAMLALGWEPYQNDHEDANGQFEMNWQYDDALITADRHAFFKYMVKSIAEKHGLRATFMPKPFANLTGNGCHIHVSLWKGGNNVFDDTSGELGLSRLAYHFIGGVMHSAEALCAITNPTVNSYKRINAPRDPVGRDLVAEHRDLYRQQPHPHDPHSRSGRFELRLADGAANPYLLQAAFWRPGSTAFAQQRDPGRAPRHQHVHRWPYGHGRQNTCRSICSTRCARSLNRRCYETPSAKERSQPISSSKTTIGTLIPVI